jgi:ubiquitin carboxyl-terminal hydrolase 25/28
VYPNKEYPDDIEVNNTFIINLHDRPFDIREGLDFNFGREDVDHIKDNRLVGIAKRYQTVVKAAPFLQIYFQNQQGTNVVAPDGTTTWKTELIEHHVKLPETINMQRYMETSSPALLQMRQRSWDLREKRKALRTECDELLATGVEGLEGPDALDATWQFIDDLGDELDDTSAVKANLRAETELRRSKIEKATTEIEEIEKELSSLSFDKFDTPDMEYRLFAVFVHRGTQYAGHYWIYIHDFINNVWRKYEDSTVAIVTDLGEIFEAREARQQGRPNFVVYVKDDRKDVLTDVLHREKPEGVDVEMADATQPQVESQNSEFKMMEVEGEDAGQFYLG